MDSLGRDCTSVAAQSSDATRGVSSINQVRMAAGDGEVARVARVGLQRGHSPGASSVIRWFMPLPNGLLD